MIDAKEVIAQAEKEVAEEEYRRKVELEKARLRLRKSFWVRLFPWRITIVRRDDLLDLPEEKLIETLKTAYGWEEEYCISIYSAGLFGPTPKHLKKRGR